MEEKQNLKEELKVCGTCQAWDGWTDHEGHWCYCEVTHKIHHCGDPACDNYIKLFKSNKSCQNQTTQSNQTDGPQ